MNLNSPLWHVPFRFDIVSNNIFPLQSHSLTGTYFYQCLELEALRHVDSMGSETNLWIRVPQLSAYHYEKVGLRNPCTVNTASLPR